jgi:predicted RNA-binding Zn-ribbon protein involved in translation (DUF1610 family)
MIKRDRQGCQVEEKIGVVELYLSCRNPRCGFAQIRCPDCRTEHLLVFSCQTRGFGPAFHAKRLEAWGEQMQHKVILTAD